jgi:AraC-like DNA-binding protein
MELKYPEEHLSCFNYETPGRPLAEVLQMMAGECLQRQTTVTLIVFALAGSVTLCWGDGATSYTLEKGWFMLLPPGRGFTVGCDDDAAGVLLLRVYDNISLCDGYSIEELYRQADASVAEHTHLVANQVIEKYIDLLVSNIRNELLCSRFLSDKARELFIYLRVYYTKEEVAGFFLPLVSADARFMDFVWRNYRKARNVAHFARMANCSMATFKKKFGRIVGSSPSVWLARQKAMNVYHDLCRSDKNIKEIAREYHFSSEPHLCTFCRVHLHETPGRLRARR